MRLQDAVPYFVKVFVKRIAYQLYRLSDDFYKSATFSKYDFQAIIIFRKHLKRNSNCIDVGANVGHILREMINAAPNGQHIAFEPIPDLFNQLQKRYGNKAKLYNYALSDQEEQVEFHYYKDSPALSGFKERKKLGRHDILKLQVETKMLDRIIPSDRPVDLIKIDVEGAELSVLQGATEILKKNKPIVLFEAGMGGFDEYNATPEQFFDLFSECGLSLSLMEYFLQSKRPFSKEEFCGQFYKQYNYFYIAYDATKI